MKRKAIRLYKGGQTSGAGGSTGAREHREMTSDEMIDKLKELAADNPELAKQLNEAFKPEKKTRTKFDPSSVPGAIDLRKADIMETITGANGEKYKQASLDKVRKIVNGMSDEQLTASAQLSGIRKNELFGAKGNKLKERVANLVTSRRNIGNVFAYYDDKSAAAKAWGRRGES